MNSRGEIAIVACRSGEQFGAKLCSELSSIDGASNSRIRLSPLEVKIFENGEVNPTILKSVRGKDVYLVQCCDNRGTGINHSENVVEMIWALNALYNAGAQYLSLVVPCYPYARKDEPEGRDTIGAKFIAELTKTAGANHIITIDLHSRKIKGFMPTGLRMDNLPIVPLALEYLRAHFNNQMNDVVIVSPDVGGSERVKEVADYLGARHTFCEKQRLEAGKVGQMYILDKVDGYRVVLLDDMVDTAGSVEKAVDLIVSKDVKDVLIFCSHPLLNKRAPEILSKLYREGKISKVVGTDSIPHPKEFIKRNPWLYQISVAPLVANVICRINKNSSISDLYGP